MKLTTTSLHKEKHIYDEPVNRHVTLSLVLASVNWSPHIHVPSYLGPLLDLISNMPSMTIQKENFMSVPQAVAQMICN